MTRKQFDRPFDGAVPLMIAHLLDRTLTDSHYVGTTYPTQISLLLSTRLILSYWLRRIQRMLAKADLKDIGPGGSFRGMLLPPAVKNDVDSKPFELAPYCYLLTSLS